MTEEPDELIYQKGIDVALNELAPKGTAIVGWALVWESLDDDGERRLHREKSEFTSHWTAIGYWHEALNGDWSEDDDDGS